MRIHMTDEGMVGYCGKVPGISWEDGHPRCMWVERRDAKTDEELYEMMGRVTCISCQKSKLFSDIMKALGMKFYPYGSFEDMMDMAP